MWHFTQHVHIRMVERDYAQDELLQILNGEVPALIYPSPKDQFVDLHFGRVGKKYLMIPVDRVTGSVITVRPMRKGEREAYLKEVGNG